MDNVFVAEVNLSVDTRFVAVLALALFGVRMSENENYDDIARALHDSTWQPIVFDASNRDSFKSLVEKSFDNFDWETATRIGASYFLSNYGGVDAIVRSNAQAAALVQKGIADAALEARQLEAARAVKNNGEEITPEADNGKQASGKLKEILDHLGIKPDQVKVVNMSDLLREQSNG